MVYTVPLALQDYMTVLFSGIGLGLLTSMINQMDRELGRMALIGMILTIAGGTLKATGKLIMAAGGPDLPVLNLGLFPLIAPGFTLFAWALYQIRRTLRSQPPLRNPWLVPLLVIAFFAIGSTVIGINGGPWRVGLILLATLSNFAILLMLTFASWGRKLWLTGALFFTTLVVVLVMSQLAQIPFDNIGMIWFEQIAQTIAQALFAVASWQYGQEVLNTYRTNLVPQPAWSQAS